MSPRGAVAVAVVASIVGSGCVEKAGPVEDEGTERASRVRQETWGDVVRRKCLADEWPGPWTLCPQANWVGRVVTKAGYRIVGETGSALVAAGGGRSFYIWATEAAEVAEETGASLDRTRNEEGYALVARVVGVRVYGDGIRTSWAANGFVFWISPGPRAESIAPNADELAPLVRASGTLPPPTP